MHARESKISPLARSVSYAALVAALSTAAQAQDDERIAAAGRQAAGECIPIETREPNVPEQEPAFAEQTRACEIASDVDFEVTVLASELEHPWAVEPLPNGDLLVTERPGRMRIVTADGEVGEPIDGVPEAQTGGQ